VKNGNLSLEALDSEAGARSFAVPADIPIIPLTFLICEEVGKCLVVYGT